LFKRKIPLANLLSHTRQREEWRNVTEAGRGTEVIDIEREF